MSSHCVVLAKVGGKLQFFSLTTNANRARLKQAARRLLRARFGNQPFQFLVASNSKFGEL